jgi:hypothetical protein
MWTAAAPLPYYSAYRPSRRKVSSSSNNKKEASPTSLSPVTTAPSAAPAQHASHNITDLLEPAVDGPPSPERIRALNKQMKRASILDKHQSQHTTSSGSSSLRSLGSDRPSWEQTLENITLSRRSSGRSTASSMPSRERPDSVQLFGKTIFNRRGRLKRESSAHSSSGSSLYSAELPYDGPPSATKDHFIPALFSRRRTMKPDSIGGEDAGQQRRIQISGPYNFQHVTHTRRDHLPNLQRTSRMELVSEFSALRAAQAPTTGSLRGIEADDLHFSNFSSEALHLEEEYLTGAGSSEPRTHILLDRPHAFPRQAPAQPGPRRLIKHSRSQEQLRISPPRPVRPPRPPIEPALLPPVPPPRVSSRLSIRYDGFDPLNTTSLDRPQTSGGFRHPQPFSPGPDDLEPPATSHGFIPRSSDFEALSDPRFSHAITTPDDAAWPLTSSTSFGFETGLADVPEEEENYILARRSRASLVSNNSSLRGSQSVPMLRQLAQAQPAASQRPPSGASDTLGRFDMFAAQRALRAGTQDVSAEILPRESWEDAIDYCYEHEADADFDYAWDRPSLDLTREDDIYTPVEDLEGGGRLRPSATHAGPGSSPGLLSTTSHFDAPALSPASQASTNTQQEALTPTAPTIPVTSNFSLPRSELPYRSPKPSHLRNASYASSFKESHGFHLSPSLLIPNDFRQQMILDDVEIHEYQGHDGLMIHSAGLPYDDDDREEPTMTMDTSKLLMQPDRLSGSTTGTNSSDETDSSAERHTSTTSTWTAITRLTASTTSLSHLDGWNGKSHPSIPEQGLDPDDQSESGRGTAVPVSPKSPFSEPDMTPSPAFDAPLRGQISRTVSRDNIQDLKTRGSMKHRRSRARTTSLTTTTPPLPAQYGIFPPIYSGNRI